MDRLAGIVLVILLVGAACADSGNGPAMPISEETTDEVVPVAQTTPETSPEAVELPQLSDFGESLLVSGLDNIYGAGRPYPPPAPGGGGGGNVPEGWQLPTGAAGGVVTFPSVTGEITPINGTEPLHGPEGTKAYSTSVNQYEGISGIDHEGRQMFLVGVFLTDATPSDPAPSTLDFTKPPASDLIAPEIGQVFLIGDGNDYRYKVPRGATRLFLGFADGAFGRGPVGYYGNNGGQLKVMVALSKG